MAKLLAKPYEQFETRSGVLYRADKYGVITPIVMGSDIADLLDKGVILLPGNPQSLDNLSAATDPMEYDDHTQDYGPGSVWINTHNVRVWICKAATRGKAVWELSCGETDKPKQHAQL
jgi:hypothetical protein